MKNLLVCLILIIFTTTLCSISNEESINAKSVIVSEPDLLDVTYTTPDSPDQHDNPGEGNWYENTYTDLGWTEIEVTQEGTVGYVNIQCYWNSDSYPEEGSFWFTSPAGNTYELFTASEVGEIFLNIDVIETAGEILSGTWVIFIEDTYGDGGHQVTDLEITFFYSDGENPPVLNPPTDLTATVDDHEIILNWLPPDIVRKSRELLGYNIYRNDEQIANVTVSVTTYPDANLPASTYTYYVTAVYSDGESEPSNVVEAEVTTGTNDNTAEVTGLNGNYPNPFNPVTHINFSVKATERVMIDICNLRGQKVRTLVNSVFEQGNHSVEWNGKDDNSTDVSSGVYFCKMTTDRYTSTKKMLLLK